MNEPNKPPTAAPLHGIVHTPGPWVYDSGCFYAKCQLDENGQTYETPIAELLEGRPLDTDGNAKLIAASPCLKEALIKIREILDSQNYCQKHNLGLYAIVNEALSKVV
jgi:hypothetical protein